MPAPYAEAVDERAEDRPEDESMHAADVPPDHVPPPSPPTGTARRLLLVVALVVSLEALALIGLAVAEASVVTAGRVGLGVSTAVFLGLFGVMLLAGANRVLKGYSWARGFLVFSQLIQLLLSFNFRGDVWWITPSLAASAVVVLVCLLAPPVTRALGDDHGV